MNKIIELLTKVKEGRLTIDEAVEYLREWPYQDLGFAKVDHHRTVRNGMPEVIFGEGKEPKQVAAIAASLWNKKNNILVTRSSAAQYRAVLQVIPTAEYYKQANIITAKVADAYCEGQVAIFSAGTADQNVAEEAAVTLEFLGVNVQRIYDVGVAGIHRLFDKIKFAADCHVIIVVAGMEGALPSVVSGMVDSPVIAVPTSVGYGANFEGLAALLGMLNSCAAGVGVVNINNGFGAAALAHSIILSGRKFK